MNLLFAGPGGSREKNALEAINHLLECSMDMMMHGKGPRGWSAILMHVTDTVSRNRANAAASVVKAVYTVAADHEDS